MILNCIERKKFLFKFNFHNCISVMALNKATNLYEHPRSSHNRESNINKIRRV